MNYRGQNIELRKKYIADVGFEKAAYASDDEIEEHYTNAGYEMFYASAFNQDRILFLNKKTKDWFEVNR